MVATLFIFPTYSVKNELKNDFIGNFEGEEYIKAGKDFYIHFSPEEGIDFEKSSFNLSHKEKIALEKSPEWIRLLLARQFENLGDEYADLIINADKKYADEIAFVIATSPSNDVAEPSLIYKNAYFIYKNDEYLDYAKIIDFENGSSTLIYKTMEDGKEKEIVCPMDIYYWYVVHPRITFENASYIYGKFWREYLFYHNDIGYPLLLEKLKGIKYLWDNQSYHPPAKRTWKWSMKNHPTAIEALNYWVGKSVNQLAIGDRPGQPNEIYHEHNGYCGEVQQISVAGQRTALIPSIGINNLGEDHVWREFWERGWHECDNWWADGGGSVDNYNEYRYTWGKIMSSVFSWNGDSSINDVTAKYIRREDRGRIEVSVRDSFGKPVDGVRVMVFGTWKANEFKNKLWNKYVENLWQKLPEWLRERWQEKYEEVKKFYREKVPGLIPWILPSIWNYTDVDGKCSFNLGLGHSYLLALQKDDLLYAGPYSVGKSNALRYLLFLKQNETEEVNIRFIIPDFKKNLKAREISSPSEGKYNFKLNFKCTGYQEQRNPWDWKNALEKVNSKINFFIVDKENFNRYREGKSFECYEYTYDKNGNVEFNADDEIYFVFNNSAKRTDSLLKFSLIVKGKGKFIHITHPYNNFGKIILNAGEAILKGYSTGEGEIEIDGNKWNVYGNFEIRWNTGTGNYILNAKCGDFSKKYEIEVVDYSIPSLNIIEPEENEIFHKYVVLKGNACDNVGVKDIRIYIDREYQMRFNESFYLKVFLPSGDYCAKFVVEDVSGLKKIERVNFTISGNKSKPLIKEIKHQPYNITEESNIIIYADIEPNFYKIKDVFIIFDGEEMEMYRYADFPPQPRHEEDELRNVSNEPVYGIEIGQLSAGVYRYSIKAVDTAGNEAVSNEYEIYVE
ncbi:MAG TPA: hypothetical protein ENI33_03875 [Thermoplasmatales archaeon]|nr:hypothetical protein [Thermoplasmatales archaeon]